MTNYENYRRWQLRYMSAPSDKQRESAKKHLINAIKKLAK